MTAYLDHASTTPLRPEAAQALLAEAAHVGNPSSLHSSGRRARAVVEEARERLAAALGARPAEVVWTSGGTEADNLAVKGLFWARRAQDPRRRRVLVSAAEHHAVLDCVEWLEQHEDAEVRRLPVDAWGRTDLGVLRAEVADAPEQIALVALMWANNEVGTVQPVAEAAEIAHAAGIPLHTDAVQAVGHLPVDFAACGADTLALSAHKFGGPVGAGALLVRRGTALVPLQHGGGQELGVRSGTLDAAAAHATAAALSAAVASMPAEPARLARLAERLVGGLRARVEGVELRGDPRRGPEHRLPGNVHVTVAGCQGDSLLYLLDAAGVECSTGSACQAGVPQPSHVLLATGLSPEEAAGALRFTLGWSSTDADVDAVLEAVGPAVERARRAGASSRAARSRRRAAAASPAAPGRGGGLMRVLAAMSGGVDSAVAAARAVDAGHEVVGVHMALSRAPGTLRTGSRGCCTIEDSLDARRAADLLGIPFYVWDLSEDFVEDVVADFVAEYAAGRTPNPCVRCNERIKFAALLDKGIALGFDAVCTGHYARVERGADGRAQLHRAADAAKDQSYVLAVLDADQVAHAMFPLGDAPTKAQVRAEAERRGLPVAHKPDSHDICFIPDGDTRGFLADKLGPLPGEVLDEDGAVLGTHTGTYGFTVGQRKGLGVGRPAADGRPRYVLSIEPVRRTVTVGPAERLSVGELHALDPVWSAPAPVGPVEVHAQVRAHGEPVPAVAELRDGRVVVALRTPLTGVAPGQTVALYAGTRVLGSATIAGTRPA